MNYPIWELTTLGGGFWIALVAVVHVYVAHFAVGGGLFLILCEKKGYRENSQAILDYTKKHTKFFLLLTMVFGGLTGVGIWFTISLLSPGATSVLIHNFVFGWATEWVFFVGEIVALFIYFYTFGKMQRQKHLTIGWIYFICAWMSLFIITGIIDFMLTPGAWLENRDFWSGFFNPTFWPSVFFRTFISFVFASIFALVTSSFLKDDKTRQTMMRYAVKWMPVPFILMLASGYWYLQAVPPETREIILKVSPEMRTYMDWFIYLSPVLFLAVLAMSIRLPKGLQRTATLVLLILGLLYMGSFEFLREGGRRPYLIHGYMYSNSIPVSQAQEINRQGVLKTAKWTKHKKVTPENRINAGEEIFQLQCSSCHSIGGPMNDILPLTEDFKTVYGMDSMLNGMGKINNYMPPFLGTHMEREALAAYIVRELNGYEKQETVYDPPKLDYEIPAHEEDDEYVLLAWNNLGMHCISDSDPYWILLPPANDLFAQLIRKGDFPEIVTQGVKLRYKVQNGFRNPAGEVRFWEFSQSLVGKKLPLNVGVSGNPVTDGEMHPNEDLGAFEASLVPVVPYPKDGSFNPYPLYTVEAVDEDSGEVLAKTRFVAPTSTEMGCKNCHGGEWRVDGVAGFSDETSANILKVHDRINQTELLEKAKAGNPMLCQSCHSDPVLGAEGKPDIPNFPAAIHGWHANYLTDRGTEACFKCHPSSAAGPTGCLRGVHSGVGLDCVSCHGTLEDHALSLLKHEKEKGKDVEKLMLHLEPRTVKSKEMINPRLPWLNEPDCLNCHKDFRKPESKDVTAFNQWTKSADELFRLRTGYMGIMCEACHGSTHANYPAKNIYGMDRDNIPPMQYQGNNLPIGAENNCRVCHTMDMDFSAHHPNMIHDFRNRELMRKK
jgi:cytochrome bd-type quinol oxidase subunit 1